MSSQIAAAATTTVHERLRAHFTKDPMLLHELSHAKRFLERFAGDHEFRTRLLSGLVSLEDAARECGCGLDVTSLQPVFHPSFVQFRAKATLNDWPLTYKWDAHLREMIGILGDIRQAGDTAGAVPAFDAWRARQINRCQFELGPSGNGIVHPPIAFELSSGCSVGCWFCGISAKKFGGHFSLSEGGQQEWREIVRAASNVLGRGLGNGFLYWATDPLDNPDYVGFLEEFERIAGCVPQTTTAIPLRNVELTRAVLRMWDRTHGIVNRFSVLSTNVLKRIHETFTPEELLGVELVLQNKKSQGITKFRAGRAGAERSAAIEGAEVADTKRSSEDLAEGTIACVSGFLVNIVERTVRLVSPTSPSKQWPDGFIVFDSGRYQTSSEFEHLLRAIIERSMKQTLRARSPLHFSRSSRFAMNGDIASIQNSWLRLESADLAAVGPLVQLGELSPIEILDRCVREGYDAMKVVAVIEQLWKAGIVEQAPESSAV